MKISLIYVNYNTAEYILKSIQSLLELNLKLNYEIIIVDNGSYDVDVLKNSFFHKNEVQIILINTNIGFGKACNIGAQNSSGEFITFVNPDIFFFQNPFPLIFTFITSIKKFGVVGAELLNSDKTMQYSYNDFPGLGWEFSELFNLTDKYISRKLREIRNKPFEVDWVIGAFMFMKKNVFMEVGGFDEDFFLYYEDTDLQKRINNAGYKNYLVPDAKVMHGTKSSIKGEEGNKAYNVYMNKSKMLYFYKHSNFLVRNFVRVINLIRILSRLVLFPLKALMQKSSLSDLKILINNFTVYLHTKAYYYN